MPAEDAEVRILPKKKLVERRQEFFALWQGYSEEAEAPEIERTLTRINLQQDQE